MTVTRRSSAPASAFLSDPNRSCYWDSYEAPLQRDDLAMHEIYLALFAHHPLWARRLLALRDRIVVPLGLRPALAAQVGNDVPRSAYVVGEKIARFTLFGQNDTEIVTGGNDKHLDFRVSVQKSIDGGASRVMLTTAVMPHNFFGRAYLRIILPFHRFGVRMLLSNAAKAGRI
jgi:hypothetical protein